MENNKMIYKGLSWVIEGKLCAMPLPGRSGSEMNDLHFLQKAGITLLVSLTLKTPDLHILKSISIKSFHVPVKDYHAPTIKQLYDFVLRTEKEILNRGKVGVHCHAGLGRTGTFMAAYFVFKGEDPEDAIKKIRKIRPGSIETEEQELVIRKFYKYLKSK